MPTVVDLKNYSKDVDGVGGHNAKREIEIPKYSKDDSDLPMPAN